MRKTLSAILLLALCQSAVGVPWANLNYQRRVKLTVASPPASDMTDVVLLVDGEILATPGFNMVGSNAQNIMFTRSDGVTLMYHTVQNFDGGAGTAEIWFRSNGLGPSYDNFFYLYYSENYSGGVTFDYPDSVWARFDAVYTYDSLPLSDNRLEDLSPNNNHASQIQGPWTDAHQVAGKLGTGKAWTYGTGRVVAVPGSQLTTGNDWTVTAWAKMTGTTTDFLLQSNPCYFALIGQPSSSNKYAGQYKNTSCYSDGAGWQLYHTTDDTVKVNQWQHFAWTGADNPDSTLSFYLDGSAITYADAADFALNARATDKWPEHPIGSTAEYISIGTSMYANTNADSDNMDGLVDHFTIRSSTVAAAQIAVEYSNQNDPGAFWTVGTPEWTGNLVPTIAFANGFTELASLVLADGDSVLITGSRFGANALDIEFLGDWIEAQADGTDVDNATGWSHLYVSQGVTDAVTDSLAWSGTKALDLSVDYSTGSEESSFAFINDADFTKIFVHYNFYMGVVNIPDYTGATPYVNFKNVYLTNSAYETPLNAPNNSVMNVMHWHEGSGPSLFGFETNTFVGPAGTSLACDLQPPPYYSFASTHYFAQPIGYSKPYTYHWAGINRGVPQDRASALYAPQDGLWTQFEWYVNRGSVDDHPSGEMYWRTRHQDGQQYTGYWQYGVILRTSQGLADNCRLDPDGTDTFSFMLHFDDPDTDAPENTEASTFIVDDPFIQFGSRARVYLGNAYTWSQCTRTEIQPGIGLWRPTKIKFALRAKTFAQTQDQLSWLYVFNDDEVYNEFGFPIVVDFDPETPEDPPTIVPPPGSGKYTPHDSGGG